jgi:adenosylcobinamide kinase / adenosylcobinamide-phosphate guanylyltransferase
MYFVTGGAFNGKSKWVKAYHQLTSDNCSWFSAYQGPFPQNFSKELKNTIVLEGIDVWIREWLKELDNKMVQEKWQKVLNELRCWENDADQRKVILIGSDITKGIVPIHTEDRTWRDVCGRAFQETASQCDEVEMIWYGINRKIK